MQSVLVLVLASLLLSACGQPPVSTKPPTPIVYPNPPPSCGPNLTDRTTPEMGILVDDCREHCLPQYQIEAVCSKSGSRIFTSVTIQDISQGATLEPGCGSMAWKAWQLSMIPTPAPAAGPFTEPTTSADCFGVNPTVASLPGNRLYFSGQ